MSYPTQNTKVKLRKLTGIEWANSQIRLTDGEPGFDTTNSIMKIGFGKKLWKDLPAIGNASPDYETPPPSVKNLAVTSTNRVDHVDVTWAYPIRRPVGFQAEDIPVILYLNAEITYGTSGRIIIPTTTVTDFISANITTIRIFAYYELGYTTPTSSIDNSTTPPVFRYYNGSVLSLTGTPKVEVWYSNYNPGSNKSSADLGLFTITQGPPSPIPLPTISITETKKLRIDITPPLRFNVETPGDNVVTMSYSIRSIFDTTQGILFRDITELGSALTYITIADAAPYTTYRVVVRATNSYGLYVESQNNYTTNSLINNGPPSTPLNVVATLNLGASNASSKTVDFTFSPSTPNVADASDSQTVRYTISLSTSPVARVFTIPFITGAPYRFSVSAFANTTYTYSITATNSYSSASPTTPANFAVTSIIRPGPPSVPTSLSSSFIETVTPPRITFVCSPPVTYNTLDSSDPDTSYTYAITVSKTFSGFTSIIVTNADLGSLRTYTIDAESNTRYDYTFTVKNTHTEVSSSASAFNAGKVLVYRGPPSLPRSLISAMDPSGDGFSAINFSFTAPLYANDNQRGDGTIDHYEITIRQGINPVIVSRNIGTNLLFRYTPITRYTDYSFTIVAVNTYGLSSSQNSNTFRTGPLIPQGGPASITNPIVTLVGPTTLTPTLTISFTGSAYGNINGNVDITAVVTNYSLVVRTASTSSPTTILTTNTYNLGLITQKTGITATSNTIYTYYVVSTNSYGLTTRTPTSEYLSYSINSLTPRGSPTAPTVSTSYVDTTLSTPKFIIPFIPSTYENDADQTDHPSMSYSIAITVSSGQSLGSIPVVTSSPFLFSVTAIQNVTYSYTITGTNSYGNSTSSTSYVNIKPRAPPSAVTVSSGATIAATPPTLPTLYINFSAPSSPNTYYTSDTSAVPLTYVLNITAVPDFHSQTNSYESNENGTGLSFSGISAYSNTSYRWTITSTNQYGYSSTSNQFSYNTDTSLPYPASLPITSNGITYYTNASRANYSGGVFIITNSNISNVLRTSTSIVSNGSIPVGDFSITGTYPSNTLTFTNTSGTGSQNLTSRGITIGTFVANSAAADFYAAIPADAGIIYYMPNNTITVNINSTTYPVDYSTNRIVFHSVNGDSLPFDFYMSALTNTSTIPSTLTATLTLASSSSPIQRSGFTIYPNLTFTISATATSLGDYFFPSDWSSQFIVSWQQQPINIPITNITVPSSNTYSVSNSYSIGLYNGRVSGTVQFKNLNGANTAANLAYSGIGSSSDIFIDNSSYTFSSPNLLVTQVPTLNNAVVAGSISVAGAAYSLNYYNNATSLSSNTLLIYNGKFRSPFNLTSELRTKYSYSDTGTRYATFGFIIPSGSSYVGKNVAITMSGIEGTITATSDSLNIFIAGSKPIISYRFETQPSVASNPDYRLPQSRNILPNVNENYTTGWISLNNSLGQNISTGNYNNNSGSTVFYGTTQPCTYNESSITFRGFVPPMKLNLYPEPVFLYITIGTPLTSSIAFSGIQYNFIDAI